MLTEFLDHPVHPTLPRFKLGQEIIVMKILTKNQKSQAKIWSSLFCNRTREKIVTRMGLEHRASCSPCRYSNH